MTRNWRPALIVTATTGLLAIGGSIAAFASWTTAPAASSLTITAAALPTMAAPRVLLIGRPVVRWDRVSLRAGVPVKRYVVTRHVGASSVVACDVPAVLATCVDLGAPVSKLMSYSVHATFERWAGAAGPRSGSVTVPFGLAAPAPAVVAKVTAAGTAPVPSGETTPEPGTTQPGTDRPETTQTPPGTDPSGSTQPGTAQPGTGQPETARPDATQPGTPGTGEAEGETTESGTGGPGRSDEAPGRPDDPPGRSGEARRRLSD
jgi:hypothetical protein